MHKLFTTDCPNCRALETLLDRAQISYEKINSTPEEMIAKGWTTAPMLVLTDGTEYDYMKAFRWIKQEKH